MSEDRFYTEVNKTLLVYSMSDKSLIDSYELSGHCFSSLIDDNFLYLGGESKLYIFKVTKEKLTQPKQVETRT